MTRKVSRLEEGGERSREVVELTFEIFPFFPTNPSGAFFIDKIGRRPAFLGCSVAMICGL